MIRPKGLGRGLDALLSGGNSESSEPGALQTVAVDRLRAGKLQPRMRFDEEALAELAASIKEQGVMQPILVRPAEGNRFEIIAGERRFRAAQRAGLSEVPVLVKRVDDHNALALALIENIQREDLESARGSAGSRAARRGIRAHSRRRGQGRGALAQRGQQSPAPHAAREARAGLPRQRRDRDGSRAPSSRCPRRSRAARPRAS